MLFCFNTEGIFNKLLHLSGFFHAFYANLRQRRHYPSVYQVPQG